MNGTAPDVSVIVAVYNTMPYLTRCMESLINQSIGVDRLEVFAVDDGSTDGSGAELDRFAREHPGTITVIHQQNSGGPGAPSNRALDLANGRFVYFVGADDHLGEEALERLVDGADAWQSDVIFGTMVGTNGRRIPNSIFESTEADVDLYTSDLPFLLSNTKLFRRDMVEKHRIRFPENLPLGSDQPFTIAALVHSRRTSVLTGYTFYYAVKREDLSNISYARTSLERVAATRWIMDFIAGLIEPGERRDAVLRRHFLAELSRCLHMEFFDGSEAEQAQLCAEVGTLVEDYLTETVRRALAIQHRVRFELARAGRVDLLRDVILTEFGPDRHRPPFVSDGEKVFMGYAGLDADGVADRAYRVGHRRFLDPVSAGLQISTRLGPDGALLIEVEVPILSRHGDDIAEIAMVALPKGADAPGLSADVVDSPASATLAHTSFARSESGATSQLTFSIDPRELVAQRSDRRTRGSLRLCFRLGDMDFDFPVPAPDDAIQTVARCAGRAYAIEFLGDQNGALVVESSPPAPVWMLSAARRRVRQFGRTRRFERKHR